MASSTQPEPTTGPTLFGDLLALARRSWIRQMADGLRRRGYDDYRASDAAACRRLLRGPIPVGRVADGQGVSRQAARKIVEGLEQRNYVTTERDVGDARRLNVALTPAGEAYAWAVVEVINALNGALTERVDREALAGARKALLAVLSGEGGVRE